MPKHWREVKKEIHKELEKIWFEEPEEVTMNKMGVYPSGAGAGGQIMGNLFFLVADTEAMGWETTEPAMFAMIDDDGFELDHCKKMFQYLTETNARLQGSTMEPGCRHPWLNMPKMWKFYTEVVESFETVETKEEMKSLMWSWFCYVNRYHWWYWNVFPWELGLSRPRIDESYLKRLAYFQGMEVVRKEGE